MSKDEQRKEKTNQGVVQLLNNRKREKKLEDKQKKQQRRNELNRTEDIKDRALSFL